MYEQLGRVTKDVTSCYQHPEPDARDSAAELTIDTREDAASWISA